MRKLILVFAAFAATACVRTATNEATGAVDVDVESPTKRGEDWSANLNAGTNFPGVSGSAKALVAEGAMDVTVTLNGATTGANYVWAIHEGKCDAPGAMVGSMSDYPAITVANDGRATINARVPHRLDEAKDYTVIVHASASDMASIVACGDLDD
jgi:hypothetical protein